MFKSIQQQLVIIYALLIMQVLLTTALQAQNSSANWRKISELPYLVLSGNDIQQEFKQLMQQGPGSTAASQKRDQPTHLMAYMGTQMAGLKENLQRNVNHKQAGTPVNQAFTKRHDIGIAIPEKLNRMYQQTARQAGLTWTVTDLAPDLNYQASASQEAASLGLLMGVSALYEHITKRKEMYNVMLVANFSNREMVLTDSYVAAGKMSHFPVGKRIPGARAGQVFVGVFVFEKSFDSYGMSAALRLESSVNAIHVGFGMEHRAAAYAEGKNTCVIAFGQEKTPQAFLSRQMLSAQRKTRQVWQQTQNSSLIASMRIVSIERISAVNSQVRNPYETTYPKMLVAISDLETLPATDYMLPIKSPQGGGQLLSSRR